MRRFTLIVLLSTAACGRSAWYSAGTDQAGSDSDGPPGCTSSCGALALTTASFVTSSDSVTFEGACVSGHTVTVTGDLSATTDCTSGRFAFTPTVTSDGAYTVRFVQGDIASPSQVVGTWIRDTTPPVFATGTALTDGGTTSFIRYASLSAHITDALTEVDAVCIKVDDTAAPDIADPCWLVLGGGITQATAALDVHPTDLPAELGFITGDYTAKLWARDALGNTSSLTNTEARDQLTVNYQPSPPPVVADVIATTSDAPSAPPSQTNLTVSSGGAVIIKWHASDDQPLPFNPVTVSVSADDINFTEVATNLVNGVNGACTVDSSSTLDDNATGCYVWTSTTSNYLRVRVVVQDAQGFRSGGSAPPMNAWPMSIIAGNLDPGTGLTATSSMFFSTTSTLSAGNTGTLVVLRDGTIYFRDVDRGIVSVAPKDGVQRIIVPRTGVTSADGPLATATSRYPLQLTTDVNERLYFVDYDRVRRIDVHASPPTVTTVLGGGTSEADGVGPFEVKLLATSYDYGGVRNLIVLPNGDMWFQGDYPYTTPTAGARVRVYEQATGKVRSIAPNGTGDGVDSTVDISHCILQGFSLGYDLQTSNVTSLLFTLQHSTTLAGCDGDRRFVRTVADPATGTTTAFFAAQSSWDANNTQITARTGEIYTLSRQGGIVKYLPATRTWQTVLGGAGVGDCDDGQNVSTCLTDLQDGYIDQEGRVRFVQRGRIRAVDGSGIVRTLAGQNVSAGDGELATTARFGQIDVVRKRSSGYALLDISGVTLRQVTPGATVTRIAGNGAVGWPNKTTSAITQPLNVTTDGRSWSSFAVEPTSGDIFYGRTVSNMARLTSGLWVDVIGNDTAAVFLDDPASDGLAGLSIKLTAQPSTINFPPRALGFSGSTFLMGRDRYTNPGAIYQNAFLKTYSGSGWVQSAFAGTTANDASNWCADGTTLTSCTLPQLGDTQTVMPVYSASAGGWYTAITYASTIKKLVPGGAMASPGLPFTSKAIVSVALDAANDQLIYCDSTGRLNLHPLTSGAESVIPWTLAPTTYCAGIGMEFDAATRTLIVPIRSNHLYGLAAVKVP